MTHTALCHTVHRPCCVVIIIIIIIDLFIYLFIYLYYYALQPLKSCCANWVRRFNFRHQASPRVSQTREHPTAEGETVGEKCSVNFAQMPTYTLDLGIFYML